MSASQVSQEFMDAVAAEMRRVAAERPETKMVVEMAKTQVAQSMKDCAYAVFSERIQKIKSEIGELVVEKFMSSKKELIEEVANVILSVKKELREGTKGLETKLTEELREGTKGLETKLTEELREEMKGLETKLKEELREEMKGLETKLKEELREETYALMSQDQDTQRPKRTIKPVDRLDPKREKTEGAASAPAAEPKVRSRFAFTPSEMLFVDFARTEGCFENDLFASVRVSDETEYPTGISLKNLAQWAETHFQEAASVDALVERSGRKEVRAGLKWLMTCHHSIFEKPSDIELAGVLVFMRAFLLDTHPDVAQAFPAFRSHHSVYNMIAKIESLPRKQWDEMFKKQ